MKLYIMYYTIIAVSCELGHAALRVLGGRDALQDEFPYIIRLEQHFISTKGKTKYVHQFCTGAALSSTWILTAAHCIYDTTLNNPKVKYIARYGSFFPKYLGQISIIIELFSRPGYKDFKTTMRNDIGLCRSERISVSEYAKVSAVNYRDLFGHEVLALGFGGTNASEYETPLQVLKGMLFDCLKGTTEYNKLSICLVPLCNLVATICGGDSGGPVVHASGIVGVNSQSADDCDEQTKFLVRTPGESAGIIALVTPRIDWISNIIRNKTGF